MVMGSPVCARCRPQHTATPPLLLQLIRQCPSSAVPRASSTLWEYDSRNKKIMRQPSCAEAQAVLPVDGSDAVPTEGVLVTQS